MKSSVGLLRRTIYWSLVLGIWGAIGLACLIGYHAAQLPQMSSWAVPERPPNVRIVDAGGKLIANRGVTGGEAMRLADMSPYLPLAVIAIEDRRFEHHFGIDPIGLARAMFSNILAGRITQGGSTLTQQLAKNLFLEPDRTIGRKIQEAVLALWLETRFSKDEILELYLNRVYFGAGAWGADAAANRYFDKPASRLTLGEAAMLAGLLKAPSRLSPSANPEGAEERTQLVLAAMRRDGYITDGEASLAMSMQAERARHYWSGSQHYVADMVMARLPELAGSVETDLVVETSIDIDLQTKAGAVIARTIDAHGEARETGQGAMVALDNRGGIKALVGGHDYSVSQFNRAQQARRQPGSAFKPIVYLAALEAGRTPDTVRRDAPVRIGKWQPENHDGEYRGAVTLRTALADSLNTIAAQLILEIGPDKVLETARRLGIRSPLARNASIALGTSEVTLLELASAYAAFANGGYRIDPYLVERIRDGDGNIIYERAAGKGPQVVAPRELAMMNDMLVETVTSGTGRKARLDGWQFAGKTGTTQNFRDALFVGYSARLVAAFWYGNDDGSPTRRVTGGSLPAESWSEFMAAAHRGMTPMELPGAPPPRIAVVPQFRPGRQGDLMATSSTVPRPGAEIGSGRQAGDRPTGILDILFGSRADPG